ncbi:MAG: NTP transferase domain-containing protein, partial [Brevefilum sp.]
MTSQPLTQYPVFVMCGRDPKRRRLLEVIDPEEHYKSKALLPFLGKRLIDWPLEAINQSPYVEGLYLIGLSEEDVKFDFPVHYIPVKTTAEFADKLLAGIEYIAEQGKKPDLVVISTTDAPGIQTKDINRFFEELQAFNGAEFVLSFVPEALIEAAFPGSGRVVLRFRDHQLVPGELYALSPRAIRIGKPLIAGISQRRRQINRQVTNISPSPVIRLLAQKPLMWGVIIKYLLGRATLADAEWAFSKSFDCQTRGVIIPDAGFGMDMDLPEDYERLKTYVQE